ncbi:hypothetical protein [Paenibacillus spongiae]|uniref:DUF4309 domain-containing protein n=1 Tax=Paenibacillus spongiae TaxID=2909671 RepID=A0ABY5S247_9BACL|nr:hypothetical protein [Paenibacillus spongiae]UVI27956.1 hypothetical protein L1F29_21175 [Paenibacillus spongiae]
MLPNPARIAAKTSTVLLLSVIIAGCQTTINDPVPEPGTSIGASNLNSDPNSNPDSPQKTYNSATDSGDVPVANAVADDDKTDQPDAETQSSSDKKDAKIDGKPEVTPIKEEKQWDPTAPKLRGIALGDTQTSLDRKLGKPSDAYDLEDESEKLRVNEYDGFAVGFGADKKVRFVEVFKAGVSTELNGLKIGDNKDAAVKALGKPDTNTSSVLAYKAEKALLKIDLEPKTGTIISIKLFHEAE